MMAALVNLIWTTGEPPSYTSYPAVQTCSLDQPLHLHGILELLPIPTHTDKRYCLLGMAMVMLKPC